MRTEGSPKASPAQPRDGLGDIADVVELVPDTLYALANPYAVDGSVSWHPSDVRGYAPMNCYLLKEGSDALLVDSGLPVHERSVLRGLDELLAGGERLSLFPLRVGEFDSVCNVAAIVERFAPQAIYALGVVAGPGWFDLGRGDSATRRADLEATEIRRVGASDVIALGAAGTRRVEVFEPALRLLNTHWVYDPATRALLTSDMFGHAVRTTAAGPWVVDVDDDVTTQADVEWHMLATRYWWLRGARTDELRRGLAEPFERHDVDMIAPAFGCVIRGRELVARHYLMVDEVLRRAPRLLDAVDPRDGLARA
ncbi:MAG: hypothetical protein Q8O56_04535 [Solirubrobacteraceae bacterium]|nr:hypothetical protein [Solirubrobacteraceae bacterium]